MIASGIDLTTDKEGDVYIYAGGDRSYPPSAIMPSGCYFINATERQEYVDDEAITPEDNLEEFGPVSKKICNTIKRPWSRPQQPERPLLRASAGRLWAISLSCPAWD